MGSYQCHIQYNILPNKGGSIYAENALALYSFRQMMEKWDRKKKINVLELMVGEWGVLVFFKRKWSKI